MNPHVAVIGTGSMGSLFAARLATVTQVVMLGTWSEQLAAVRRGGLVLLDPDGRRTVTRLAAADDPVVARGAWLAVVAVKGWQTERAAEWAAAILPANGLALTIQNGLGNLEVLAQELGSPRAALGVTSEGATMLEPGVVRHAGRGETHLALGQANHDRVRQTASLLTAAGFSTHVVVDAEGLLWGKIAVNAGINALTALLQVPNGDLLDHKLTRELMVQAAEEAAAVAAALGLTLPYPSAAERVLQVAEATAQNRSSMAQDLARGMPTEIMAINGAVTVAAADLNLAVPINAALVTLVKAALAGGSWTAALPDLDPAVRAAFEDLARLEVSS